MAQIIIDRDIPLFPVCRNNEGFGCVHNGELCSCVIYSSNTKLQNNFRSNDKV